MLLQCYMLFGMKRVQDVIGDGQQKKNISQTFKLFIITFYQRSILILFLNMKVDHT